MSLLRTAEYRDGRGAPRRATGRGGARRLMPRRAETARPPRAEAQRPPRTKAPRPRRMRYTPALDGIRTLAVVAVVLYHLHLPWAQGGLLGVTIFFVLSGYLITRLLLAEIDQTGRIDLKNFWLRRVRRLVPAIVTVVVVTAALCTVFNHVMLTKMRSDILPSLFFVNNWWQIFNNVSYFNALGDPSPLTHFWSLAIEEQFYLIWPPVLLLLTRLGAGRPVVRRTVLVLALVSAGAMAVLYNPAVDPSRLYYGTDTRAFSLLLGAWLAFIPEGAMRPARLVRMLGLERFLPARAANDPAAEALSPEELEALNAASPSGYAAEAEQRLVAGAGPRAAASGPAGAGVPGAGTPSAAAGFPGAPGSRRSARRTAASGNPALALYARLAGGASGWQLDLVGLVGIVGLVLLTVFSNGYTAFPYQGGTLLTSVLTLTVIAAAVQPEGIVMRVLSLPPLVWLGKRSYGIYLWHYPLLLLMNPVANVAETPWWLMVVQALVVVGAAELSYRFVETPCRKGAIGALVRRVRAEGLRPAGVARTYPVQTAVVSLVCVLAVGGLAFVPNTSALSAEGAALLSDDAATSGDGASAGDTQDAATSTDAGDATDSGSADDGAASAGAALDEDGFPEGAYDVVMVGDSVSLRAVPNFEETFPHGHIDAAKSRQFSAGAEAYANYVQQDLAGKIAVFALGTNGLVTDEAIDGLMATVGEDRIAVFVNTRSPQPWVQATNDAIARAPNRYSNVRVIDWYSYSANRNDLFDGDGTHLSAGGAAEYIDLVYQAIKDDLPLHPEDHANDPAVTTATNALNALGAALAPK